MGKQAGEEPGATGPSQLCSRARWGLWGSMGETQTLSGSGVHPDSSRVCHVDQWAQKGLRAGSASR